MLGTRERAFSLFIPRTTTFLFLLVVLDRLFPNSVLAMHFANSLDESYGKKNYKHKPLLPCISSVLVAERAMLLLRSVPWKCVGRYVSTCIELGLRATISPQGN